MPTASKKTKSAKSTAKRGGAAAGKKTVKGRTQAAKRKPDKRALAKKKQFFSGEIKIILTAVLGLFLFLSNFGVMGKVGTFFSQIQMGLFGMVGYAFPVLLLLSVIFYVRNQGTFLAGLKLVCSLFMIIILSALMHLLFGSKELLSPAVYYGEGVSGVLSGGVIGGCTAGALRTLSGTIGAYLILIALLIICMVFVTERSFVNAAKSGAERTARAAKEGGAIAKEAAQAYRMKQEARREERVARGIDFDALELMDDGRPAGGRVSEAAMLYAGYGRELITGQPGMEDVDDFTGHGKIRKKRRYGVDAEEMSYDTEILPNPDEFTGKIEGVPEYDYEEDTVPFEETADEPYKSYNFGMDTQETSGGNRGFGLREAKQSGYAAESDTSEPEPEGISEPRGLSAFRTEADAEGYTGARAGAHPGAYTGAYTGAQAFDGTASEAFSEVFEAEAQGASFGELNAAEAIGAGAVSAQNEAAGFEVQAVSGRAGSGTGAPRTVTATGKEVAKTTDEAKALLKKKLAGEIDRIDTGDEQKKAAAPTETENKAVAAEIQKKKIVKKPYVFPPLSLLKRGPKSSAVNQQELKETAVKLQQVLRTFGVGVTVTNVSRGPAVTRYELTPDAGVKVSRITSLSDDIKLALAAADIRIEAPIPGKAAVGIEVPNKDNATVFFREIIDTDEFRSHPSRLAFAIGKDIAGKTVVGDIAKMPHLLIAGATGSGKSVGINTLVMSLIYKSSPDDVRMIMIDPKVVELSVYNGIPHLLIPVVTDPKKAASALNWAVAEMTDRYKKFAETGVRDLKGYNAKAEAVKKQLPPDTPEEEIPKKLPQIVIIIDELADLMMVAPGEVEDAIIRLTQLARAAGLHLIIATQRPSVNVITGLIKANVPSRIAFKTASGTDSRTILDMNGAEKLLGSGDMLYFPSGAPKPSRVQGSFVSDQEVQAVVDFLTKHGAAEYSEEIGNAILNQASEPQSGTGGGTKEASPYDEYFEEAGRLIIEKEKASIGMLQRMYRIGFNRAARLMDQLSEAGVVGPEEGTKPRKILMTEAEFEAFLSGQNDG